MLYGLRTIEDGIIFKSRYLEDVIAEMKNYPSAFIVEIEEKQIKKNYSRDFLNELC